MAVWSLELKLDPLRYVNNNTSPISVRCTDVILIESHGCFLLMLQYNLYRFGAMSWISLLTLLLAIQRLLPVSLLVQVAALIIMKIYK